MEALTSSKAIAFARVSVRAYDGPQLRFFSLNHKKRCNFSLIKLVRNNGGCPVYAVPPKDQVDLDLDLETAEPQGHESEQTNESSKIVRVAFQLQKNCKFGEQFLIVGDDPMLGSWDPLDALPMTWSEGHVWTVELDIAAEKSIQFKFILKEKDGNIIWQPGSDRVIRPWETMNRITVSEDWEDAELQKIIEEPRAGQLKKIVGVSSSAEILDNPQEQVESNASKISTTEDTQIHEEDKPLAEPPMQQIIGNGISSSGEKPLAFVAENINSSEDLIMIAENINSSEDLIKRTSRKRNKNNVLQPSEESANSLGNDDTVYDVGHSGSTKSLEEGTIVKSSLFEFEGVPVLVPGLTMPPTEATDEADQDKVQEMTTVDTSGGAFETQDQNIPEFSEEQETDDSTPQEINATINNEPEMLYTEHEDQSHLFPEMEESLCNQPVDGNPLQNDIKWGQETVKKLLTKLGFL
ncbi:hypothetical protein Fmac_012245 [Flemingia macrophylla]|uniref:CBM20 domain-containing protein n=1 Tax=Flemingia macrophylla TaxID=520843 RepID=A0ABD1MPR0_9FABA